MTNIQWRWNNWDKRKEAMARHERLVNRILNQNRLETVCTDCEAVMPTSVWPMSCVVCGGGNTVSPYYC